MNKNQINITLSILTICALSFTGCKKGEDDKFLSFKSRKARLAGEWNCDKLEINEKYSDGETFSLTIENGKGVVYQNGEAVDTIEVSVEWQFNKDGTAEQVITDLESSENETYLSNWSFLSKDKANGIKNKEQISLVDAGITFNYTSYKSQATEIYSRNTEVFDLVRLTNKECIMKVEETYQESGSAQGTYSMIYYMTKKK